jgi:pseudouridine-5'-monophosphatase
MALSLRSLLSGARGVLFDMDGVLLDTEGIYTEATRRVLGPDADRFTFRVKEKLMGRSPLESATILVRELDLALSAEEYLALKKPVLLELFAACQPKPGAPALVAELARRAVPMAVGTSSDRVYFERKTAHHPWFSHFEGIICGNDPTVARHKPAPDIFLEAARLLNLPPSHCIVFEDSAAGVEAARRAKAHTIVAIVDPQLDRALVSDATHIISDYSDIVWD